MKVFIFESPLKHLFFLLSKMIRWLKDYVESSVIYSRIILIPRAIQFIGFLEKSIFIDLFYGYGFSGSSITGNIVKPIYAIFTVVIAWILLYIAAMSRSGSFFGSPSATNGPHFRHIERNYGEKGACFRFTIHPFIGLLCLSTC